MFKYMYIRIKLKDTKENRLRMERPTNFKQVKILTEKILKAECVKFILRLLMEILQILQLDTVDVRTFPFFLTKKLNYLFLLSAPLWPPSEKKKESSGRRKKTG